MIAPDPSTRVAQVAPRLSTANLGLLSGALGGDRAAIHHAIRAVVGTMPVRQKIPATVSGTVAAPGLFQPALTPLQQAQQMVSSTLTPLEQQLISSYTSQGAAGAQAIKALTAQYASQMGQVPQQLAGIYQPAESATAATDAALADRLSGAGSASSDELAQRLASIQQPGAVNPVVQQIAANGAGAGNALAGTGSAALDQLIGNSANAQTYAAKLPGIAREAGLQQLSGYEGQIGTAQAQGLAALEAKAPGLVQSAYGTLTKAQTDKAAATAKARQNQIANTLKEQGITDSETKTRAALIIANNIDPATGQINAAGQAQLAQLGISATGVAGSAGARVANDNTSAGLKRDQLSEKTRKDAATVAQGNARVAQGDARILIAQQNATTSAGRLQLAKVTAAAKKGKGSGSLTASETSKLLGIYHDGSVKNVRVAATDAQGNPVKNSSGVPQYITKSALTGQLNYQQAIAHLEGLGKTPAEARKAVDSVYAPGELGKPWLTSQQTAVLSKTGAAVGKPGRGANPAIVNGHAILDPSQFAALKKAGMLPPGKETAEGFYVIGGSGG